MKGSIGVGMGTIIYRYPYKPTGKQCTECTQMQTGYCCKILGTKPTTMELAKKCKHYKKRKKHNEKT